MSLHVVALVKQIPAFEEMRLGPDGRLVREGLALEMNAYCRRAVAQAVALAADHGGRATFLTLGPPTAEDCLREAIAWASPRGVDATGVLVTDPAFAGSDTLATARALAAAIRAIGPFDLVLAGRNSVDADTGQVGPELAELLDLAFLPAVRHLALVEGVVHARCELDDGWMQAEVALPALLSTAERLIDPCKVDPEGRAAVPAERIRTLRAADLGPGPWGADASPTAVGRVRVLEVARDRVRDAALPLGAQVDHAVRYLLARGALEPSTRALTGEVPHWATAPGARDHDRVVVVLVEPDRAELTQELLGTARQLGHALAFTTSAEGATDLGAWGADEVVVLDGALVEEDVARGLVAWASDAAPWAVLAPSTIWGREVASRAAAALSAGLTGDAIALELEQGRLVAWKPAFGGQLVAAVTASSPTQLVTVRAGTLRSVRTSERRVPVHRVAVESRHRIRVLARTRDDDLDLLADADVVVGVGQGVPPEAYGELDPLLAVLGAELAATRKVTDQGWLPRARQVGITGRSIAPRLYVAVGASGKFNHMVGVRASGTVLAINADADAPVFDAADVGIVGDWREVLPLLVAALTSAIDGRVGAPVRS